MLDIVCIILFAVYQHIICLIRYELLFWNDILIKCTDQVQNKMLPSWNFQRLKLNGQKTWSPKVNRPEKKYCNIQSTKTKVPFKFNWTVRKIKRGWLSLIASTFAWPPTLDLTQLHEHCMENCISLSLSVCRINFDLDNFSKSEFDSQVWVGD